MKCFATLSLSLGKKQLYYILTQNRKINMVILRFKCKNEKQNTKNVLNPIQKFYITSKFLNLFFFDRPFPSSLLFENQLHKGMIAPMRSGHQRSEFFFLLKTLLTKVKVEAIFAFVDFSFYILQFAEGTF